MQRGGSHFEKLRSVITHKKCSFSAYLKLVAVELTLHPVQRGPRTVTHAKLRNYHLPDDTSKRGDTSRTLRSIAVHCIAHTPPVNPCFLLQELRFQGHQKQQNRQPCGDSNSPASHHRTPCQNPAVRTPVYRADRVTRCVSRGCPSPRNLPPFNPYV